MLIDVARIAAYVSATGDDGDRWTEVAPPGFASVALFTVAPSLLFDPELDEWTKLLVHGDQQFEWAEPLRAGSYEVTGTVDRVRLRMGTAFVTFTATMHGPGGPAVESRSTFLMGTEAPPPDAEAVEPDVDARARNERDGNRLLRSASRRDLVRYAAATGDFNPIHWDHARAVAAGLPGIVCHGLLMTAWVNQLAAIGIEGASPLVQAKYRFRDPLRPAEQAVATADDSPDGPRSIELTGEAGTVLTASLTVRT